MFSEINSFKFLFVIDAHANILSLFVNVFGYSDINTPTHLVTRPMNIIIVNITTCRLANFLKSTEDPTLIKHITIPMYVQNNPLFFSKLSALAN
jgi:hypothetical protein